MPWKAAAVSELRLALVHQVRQLHVPVAHAARAFGVSRKTAYKWLGRSDGGGPIPLDDLPRAPVCRPGALEHGRPLVARQLLELRDRHGWGARKLVALLDPSPDRPAVRTVTRFLKRHGRIRPTPPPVDLQHFERGEPHELWQLDFKGPLDVGRRLAYPLVVLDDHSRYCLCLTLMHTRVQTHVFDVLWDVFGEFGLPQAILCDNEFGTRHATPRTLTLFESKLVRLGVRVAHGRSFHPQTQGKVERFNGTLHRELWPTVRRDSDEHFTADADAFRHTYNHVRPHEALGDRPPVTRLRPSPRPRPSHLPEPHYPPGVTLRKVSTVGDVRYKSCRILAGRGLTGQWVRLEERDHDLAIFYCDRVIRTLPYHQINGNAML